MNIRFLLICIVSLLHCKQAPIVNINIARVNHVTVQKAELVREMTRYRASLYARGHGTRRFLIKKAFSATKLIKVQEAELRKYKLWPYADYQVFLASLAKINSARQKEADAGMPVYGPVHYDEITYFDYCFSNAVIKLKNLRHLSEKQYRRLVLKKVAEAQITMLQKLY